MSLVDKFSRFKFNKKLLLLILLMFFSITSGTYAYLSSTEGVDNIITGSMGNISLDLDVTRVLPVNEDSNKLLLFQYDELASNLNSGCIDQDDDYSLCQLYKINLKNNDNSVNVKVNGSLSFDNDSMPNLSWVLLGNTYSASTKYTSADLPNTFNKATSTYTNFIDNYLLNSDNEVTFYILLWINEIYEIQYDSGTFSGIVKFEDSNGYGVTAEFGS